MEPTCTRCHAQRRSALVVSVGTLLVPLAATLLAVALFLGAGAAWAQRREPPARAPAARRAAAAASVAAIDAYAWRIGLLGVAALAAGVGAMNAPRARRRRAALPPAYRAAAGCSADCLEHCE